MLGAPTGSGKTAVAEIAIMRMLNQSPGAKVFQRMACSLAVLFAVLIWEDHQARWEGDLNLLTVVVLPYVHLPSP